MDNNAVEFLTREEGETLLHIARDTVRDGVTHERLPDLGQYPLTPRLQEAHGAFVALRCAGHTRGRVGSATSDVSLAETVRSHTFQAALHDLDYRPIAPNEIEDIDTEIAVICPGDRPESPFIEVHGLDEIILGRDGLYLEHAGTHGGALILPHVAVEHRWDVERFLRALCHKAGAPRGAWELPGAALYRFQAQVFRERHHSDYSNW